MNNHRIAAVFSEKNFKKWSILSFLWVCLLYQYPWRINEPPNMWRSTDCASIAYHYFHYQNPFSEPKILHILNDDGQSVGECPILYFMVAKVSSVTGYHECIFRILGFLLWALGFRWMLGIGQFFTDKKYISLYISLLVFSFPLISWYAIDTMPDIPALSLSLGGLYFFLKGTRSASLKNFLVSGILFSLGVLLKLHVVLGPAAIIGLAAAMRVFPSRYKPHPGVRNLYVLVYILPILTAKLWNMWANHYNDTHRIQFFGTRNWPGWPLWEANEDQIRSTFSVFANQFFNIPGVFALVLILVSLFYVIRKIPSNLWAAFISIYILLVMAFASYVFFGLRDNDYYFINLLQPVILSLFLIIPWIFEKYSKFNWVLILLLLGNLTLSVSKNYKRSKWDEDLVKAGLIDGSLKKFIESKGVTDHDRVLMTPDYNPELCLYLLKKKGGSNYASLDPGTDIKKIRNQHFKYIISMRGEEHKNLILKEIITHCTPIDSFKTSKLYRVNPEP